MKFTFKSPGDFEHFKFDAKYNTYPDCCFVVRRYFDNKTLAIGIEDVVGCEPVLTVTVNLDYADYGQKDPDDEHICIKSYSENEGLAEAMVKAKLVEPVPMSIFPSGFVYIPMYKMTKEFAGYIRSCLESMEEDA